MVDALLLQQATTAVAFDNIYITPFSLVSSSRPNCMSTSILSNVQRLATAPELTMVKLISKAMLWECLIYFYVDGPNRHGPCPSSY